MGLSAPKNRFKISKDPNNTNWSNNTSRFGHKLLTKQGWTPGSTLGATDASHSSHYTAASTSHIRILLKDDTLGLGAKRGSEKAENFGLAGLDSVLSRLNAKSDKDVEEAEKKAEEKKLKVFATQKFGFMNFVSGGFLVGDKIERKRTGEEEIVAAVVAVKEEKPKKRKRSKDEDEDEAEVEEQSKLKRKKKSIDLKAEARAQLLKDTSTATSEVESKSKKEKKDKKEKKEKKRKAKPEEEAPSELLTEKERRRVEKRARKEERRLKKEKRRAEKEKEKASKSSSSDESSTEQTQTGTSTPSLPTPNLGFPFGVMGGHAAVRQRYIRQKKMASMDPNALKEIFMIKTKA